jgi:bifunctional non-homologous end joining protein LigD
MTMAEPDRFVATISKAKRKGKILIDYLRNQRGSTAVMPYSARARAGAPVAVPISWDELKDIESAHAWSIDDVQEVIARAQGKPLRGWGFATQTLPEF